MRKPLTKRFIEAAISAGIAEGKPYVMLWDASPAGFGLRIRRSGIASWLLTYRPKGSVRGTSSRSITLGTWPALNVEAARALALAKVGEIASGGDPASDLRQARTRSRSLVGTALDDFERSLRQRHIVNRVMVLSSLRRGFAAELATEIADLDLRALAGIVDRIGTAKRLRKDGSSYTAPGAANDFRKNARVFLGWAALQGLVKFNALAGYRKPARSKEERRVGKLREGRALGDQELVAVWVSAGDLGAFGHLVRLGILTGLRRNELSELRWTDLDLDPTTSTITIPAARTKMGREHRVPITSLMRSVLAAQRPSVPKPNALVFPSRVNGSAMVGWSKLVPRLVKASGVSFRLHDLRRTTRTLMARLGIAEDIAEAAIGHSKTGLVRIYDLHDRWERRIDAFERLSDHVEKLLSKPLSNTSITLLRTG